MRPRYTIRDLLWLTALVAVMLTWWVDHAKLLNLINSFGRRTSIAESEFLEAKEKISGLTATQPAVAELGDISKVSDAEFNAITAAALKSRKQQRAASANGTSLSKPANRSSSQPQ